MREGGREAGPAKDAGDAGLLTAIVAARGNSEGETRRESEQEGEVRQAQPVGQEPGLVFCRQKTSERRSDSFPGDSVKRHSLTFAPPHLLNTGADMVQSEAADA